MTHVQGYKNDHAEPMISTEYDDRLWKHLGSDLFYWRNHTYLLVICYYSRYIEIAKLESTTLQDIINHMKSIFSRHGQGLTNPLPSCLGQVQILAGQVIFYFTCPEKCIEYIGNIIIPSHFQDAVECRASG